MANNATMNLAREEEGIKEGDDIEDIMGKAMEMAGTFQEAAHKMKGYADTEGQKEFFAARKVAAEELRKAAHALDPEKGPGQEQHGEESEEGA